MEVRPVPAAATILQAAERPRLEARWGSAAIRLGDGGPQATQERLDRKQAEAQAAERPRVMSRASAESLADMRSLFADAEPATQARIVQALSREARSGTRLA